MKHSIFLLLIFALLSCQSQKKTQPVATTQQPQVAVTLEARLQNIKSELKTAKVDLTAEGKYNCCVNPACDWCALREGECQCHDNLMAKKAVCPDCGLGWHNGRGVVKGVKVNQVKWDISHEHPVESGHKH